MLSRAEAIYSTSPTCIPLQVGFTNYLYAFGKNLVYFVNYFLPLNALEDGFN